MPVLTVPRWFLDSLLEHSGKDEPAYGIYSMPADEHARCWREHGQTNGPQSHRVFCRCQGNKEESALLIAAGSAFENAFHTHKHIVRII